MDNTSDSLFPLGIVEFYVDGMLSNEPNEDGHREVALIRRAQLLTDLEISVAAAIDELRAMADGRSDLLANAAAAQIGTYLASPQTTDPFHLLAGTFLVLAGADTDIVEDAVESVRRWSTLLVGSPGAA